MNKSTKHALDLIEKYTQKQHELQAAIDEIKAKCKHKDYDVRYCDTPLFQFCPKRVCIVCEKALEQEPTLAEKTALLEHYYNELDIEPESPEAFTSRVNGFNLPRLNFRV